MYTSSSSTFTRLYNCFVYAGILGQRRYILLLSAEYWALYSIVKAGMQICTKVLYQTKTYWTGVSYKKLYVCLKVQHITIGPRYFCRHFTYVKCKETWQKRTLWFSCDPSSLCCILEEMNKEQKGQNEYASWYRMNRSAHSSKNVSELRYLKIIGLAEIVSFKWFMYDWDQKMFVKFSTQDVIVVQTRRQFLSSGRSSRTVI